MAVNAVVHAFIAPTIPLSVSRFEFGSFDRPRSTRRPSVPVCKQKQSETLHTRKRRTSESKKPPPNSRTTVQKVPSATLKTFRRKGPAVFDIDRVKSAEELMPRISLDACPALVLNADFQPLSYLPLSLWPWQEVVKAVFSNRVNIVATYDVSVRSPSVIFPLPSVVSLKHYQKTDFVAPFSRFNVFLRDSFSCQYCSAQLPTTELTFDHVVPRCMGGKSNWTNVVTACVSCNLSKGRSLLEDLPYMKLAVEPKQPSSFDLQAKARLFPPKHLHESWRDYVYWNESMECDP